MRTIPRNRTKEIEAIKVRFTACVVVSADNDLKPKTIDAERAWHWLGQKPAHKLIEHTAGQKYVIQIRRGMLWYELTAPLAVGTRVFCKSPDVTHGAHAIVVRETYVSPIDGEWENHAYVAWGMGLFDLQTGAHLKAYMTPDDGTCPEHFTCSLCRYPENGKRVLRRLGL